MKLVCLAQFANRIPFCAVDRALVSVEIGPSMLVTKYRTLQPLAGNTAEGV